MIRPIFSNPTLHRLLQIWYEQIHVRNKFTYNFLVPFIECDLCMTLVNLPRKYTSNYTLKHRHYTTQLWMSLGKSLSTSSHVKLHKLQFYRIKTNRKISHFGSITKALQQVQSELSHIYEGLILRRLLITHSVSVHSVLCTLNLAEPHLRINWS